MGRSYLDELRLLALSGVEGVVPARLPVPNEDDGLLLTLLLEGLRELRRIGGLLVALVLAKDHVQDALRPELELQQSGGRVPEAAAQPDNDEGA